MNKPKRNQKTEATQPKERRKGSSSKRSSGRQTNTQNAGAKMLNAALYFQNADLPQTSVNSRVPFNDYHNIINISSSNDFAAKLPTHVYTMLCPLTIGRDAIARSTAISNWYTLLRGAKTNFSDFRPVDLANYQQACHFVKLVLSYVETTIRMTKVTSFSDTHLSYKLVQALSRNTYANVAEYNTDLNTNYDKLLDQYKRFRDWVLSSCLVADSYNIKIDQLMDHGYTDEAVSYETAPFLIFLPMISAYLSASFVYDPLTGKPTSFASGEISHFPCPYRGSVANEWYTQGEHETWLAYLIRVMQRVMALWGNTYTTITSYLAGITGVQTTMMRDPRILDTPWEAKFDPLVRLQVRNASTIIEQIATFNGTAYGNVTWDDYNTLGTHGKIIDITSFPYLGIMSDNKIVNFTYTTTSNDRSYIPSKSDPSGMIRVATGADITPAIYPITIDSSVTDPTDVPAITELLSPIDVHVEEGSTTIDFDFGVVFPYALLVNDYTPDNAAAPIPRFAMMNRVMGINDVVPYITFMAFHDSWCAITPITTTMLFSQTAGVTEVYQSVDYEQLAKTSTDSLKEGHRTIVQSYWTQWTARPNGATASAEKRVH